MSVCLHQYFLLLILFETSIVLGQTINQNETEVIDLRLSYVKVPAVQTYYVCQQFEVMASTSRGKIEKSNVKDVCCIRQIKEDKPYHVIRFEPVVNNTDLIHHMLLFGCTFEMDEKGPHPCDSLDYRCRTWLVKWDRGMLEDIVMPENSGVRIGKDTFKYILLQVHWNNEGALNNQTDSSGMRLHVTTTLRQYDIGNVQIGQNDITIPRDSGNVLISGTCSGRCTSLMLPMPVYITDVYLHMHRLGEPVEVKCWFDSSSTGHFRNHSTHFGQGSAVKQFFMIFIATYHVIYYRSTY